jgi:uncharacterized membrane protein
MPEANLPAFFIFPKRSHMKKIVANLRDTIIAGILFLLPLLLVMVMVSKAFQFLNSLNSRVAAVFGLKSIGGIPSATIVGSISILLLCLLCGYLVRITFFQNIRNWIDQKLMDLIPGYQVYREMAINKLVDEEKPLPYESAAWLLRADQTEQPVFLMETTAQGELIIFAPTAGNVQTGTILKVPANMVRIDRNVDMKSFRLLFSNLGIGVSKL